MPSLQSHHIEVSLQSTLAVGGRGFDNIETVQKKDDEYRLFIDTKHGERCVLKLNVAEATLKCYGNTRVPPFLELDLSQNAAKNICSEIEDTFSIEHKN